MEPVAPQTPHIPKEIHPLPPQTFNSFNFSIPHYHSQGHEKKFQSLGSPPSCPYTQSVKIIKTLLFPTSFTVRLFPCHSPTFHSLQVTMGHTEVH